VYTWAVIVIDQRATGDLSVNLRLVLAVGCLAVAGLTTGFGCRFAIEAGVDRETERGDDRCQTDSGEGRDGAHS